MHKGAISIPGILVRYTRYFCLLKKSRSKDKITIKSRSKDKITIESKGNHVPRINEQ